MAESDEPTEAEVDAVVDEFGGDLRAAIRALLHDLAVLATDFASAVSWGYVRGQAPLSSDRPSRDRQGRSSE